MTIHHVEGCDYLIWASHDELVRLGELLDAAIADDNHAHYAEGLPMICHEVPAAANFGAHGYPLKLLREE